MPGKHSIVPASRPTAPVEFIASRIFLVRGRKVMLDSDLGSLYQVETKALNRAVGRNLQRFPEDFVFQLTAEEAAALRRQIGASKLGRGGRRYLPHAFTQEGVAMLSSVLHSKRAAQVNITIMRAFVKLREVMATHRDLARKIGALERKFKRHDREIQVVFNAIKKLLEPPAPTPKHRIGFAVESEG